MSQHRQATIGTPHVPKVDSREFEFILSQFPTWVRLLGKKDATRCPNWNPRYGTHAVDCPLCGGDGFVYSGVSDRPIQCIMEARSPHGRSGLGDYVTQAGRIQRYDYLMYTHHWEFGQIVTGDTIIFPINTRLQEIEYNVANVIPYWGTHGNMVYITCLLWKKDVPELTEPPLTSQL